MNHRHLTEAEIQDCALGTAGLEQVEHAASCALCDAKVANYRLIFNIMDELPQPVLDFDAAQLVMSKLPQPADATPVWSERGIYLVACLLLALLFVPLYLNRNDLMKMTSGLEPVALCLIGLTTLVILVFQATEMYRKHLSKLNALISGDLQL